MHVLGELKHKDKGNVFITVWQIYSGQYTPNFIRIGWVSFTILQETFWGVFFGSQCRNNYYSIIIRIYLRFQMFWRVLWVVTVHRSSDYFLYESAWTSSLSYYHCYYYYYYYYYYHHHHHHHPVVLTVSDFAIKLLF